MSSNQTFDNSKLSTSSAQNTQLPRLQQRNKSPSPGGEPDAATYAPSRMREHLGPPEIAHDYPEDSTHRRHSSVSHQQAYYMR